MSSDAHHTGRAGTGIVKTRVEKIRYIFRDMPQESDYGIDAEIEIKDEVSGKATGRLLKAQIRSGGSHIEKETEDAFVFRSQNRWHLENWRKHALPVLIILVDVDAEIAYWAIVDQCARVTGQSWVITIPKAQRIDASAKEPWRKLANELANEVATRARADYLRIRDLWSEGRRTAAFIESRALLEQPSWRFADGKTQAEAYRSLAFWSYRRDRDAAATDAYLRKAKEADPDSDETAVHATVAMLTLGVDAALQMVASPSSTGAANLRVSLLLHSGQIDAAAAALASWPPTAARDAETARMEARLALARGDMERARERIAAATTEKPRWFGVREAAAIIDYFAALPASVFSTSTRPYPIPVPMQAVRQDDESLQRLRAAAKAFHDLATDAEDADDQLRMRTWYLAAVANDPAAQREAQRIAEEWLDEPALFAPMLPWLVERDLIAHPNKLADRISTEVESIDEPNAATDPNLILTAIRLLLSNEKVAEAWQFLSRFEQFIATHDPDAVAYWRVQLLTADGDLDGAADVLQRIRNPARRGDAESGLRMARASREKDWRAAAENLYGHFTTDGDVTALADAARLYLRHGEPEFVLETAEDLFAGIPNLSTLELICEAAWRTANYVECLAWLDKWQSVSSTKTEGLRQTRLACLLQIDPFQALRAADDLVRSYPSAANVMRALVAYIRVGDLRSLSVMARRLFTAAETDAATLLAAAQMTIVDDPDLARELWRAAMTHQIDDDDVGTALSLAHDLGEDRETRPLVARMQQLAAEGRGGVRAMSLSELLEFGGERQQELANVITAYHAGEVPVHAAATRLGWNLAEVFHVWPVENRSEETMTRHRPLLVRFGGRLAENHGLAGRKLRMDITAYLLAAELDLLDVVERVYAPIRVSRFLAASLVEQQRRLGGGQVSRTAMYQRITALADSGKIRTLESAGPAPQRHDTSDHELDEFLASTAVVSGVFVHQLPFTDSEMHPVVLEDAVAAKVRDLSELLAVAYREAAIDAQAYESAAVGLQKRKDEIETLPRTIVLSSLAAHALASGDALAQLAASADVFVSQHVLDEARGSVAWARHRSEVRGWIDRLRQQLHRGFERGIYVAAGEADVQSEDARQVEFVSLRDLIEGAGDGDALWIEDRACSRMGLAVVGVTEILQDLSGRGAITNVKRAAVLHKLRSGDARYLPLFRDDLLNDLGTARARATPDTKELEAISRLYAAYALDGNRSNSREGSQGEIAVIAEAGGVTTSVLPEIWKLHRGDHAKARQHAWWFLTYLYFGRLAVRACTDRDADVATMADDLAFDLASLYMGSIMIAAGENPERWDDSTTAAYIDWLTKAFVYRQFLSTPSLVSATAKHLAEMAATYIHRVASGDAEVAVVNMLVAKVFWLLPKDLQHAWLAADPPFGERNGISVTDHIKLGEMRIPAKPFWAAMGRWTAGKHDKRRAEVRIRSDGTDMPLEVEFEGKKERLNDPLLVRFAKGGRQECTKWAEDHPDFFDMSRERRRDKATAISELKTPQERVLAADALRTGSGQMFYATLTEQLVSGRTLPETAFYLASNAVADHLRLGGDREAAAKELVEDVGVEEALTRLMTLPLPLPEAVVQDLAQHADAGAISKRAAATAVSPFSMMHCSALMLKLSARHPELRDDGTALLRTILEPDFSTRVFATFERLYIVIHGWLSFDDEAGALTPHDRLLAAASHAGRLLDIIGAEDLEKAREFFTRVTSVPREFLARDPQFLDDVLYPTNMSYAITVVFGVCSMMRDVPPEILEAGGVKSVVQRAITRLVDTAAVGGWLVDPQLMVGREGTIYDVELSETVLRITDTSPIHLATPAELRAAAAALLEQARNDISDPSWLGLAGIIRHHPVPTDMLPGLRDIARLFSKSAPNLRDRDLVLGLVTLAGQVSASQDPELRDLVRQSALAVAREFGVGQRKAADLTEIAPAFFEIALGVSARHGEPSASARELSEFVDDLVRAWPALAYSLAMRLAHYVWTAPPDQALSLWRMLLRARENAFRVA
jgi:hypothetical protein